VWKGRLPPLLYAIIFAKNMNRTTPFDGQKPGTSGLRKKTRVFLQPNYLENFVQSIFNALPSDEMNGSTLVVGGDGRFHNDVAVQTIIKMSKANGISCVVTGTNALMATPALSAVVRGRNAYGGIILTASHNPGGIDEDFGIKYNVSNGGPAPSSITNAIYEATKTIDKYYLDADLPDVDLSTPATHSFENFQVIVVDPTEEYTALMKTVFDFNAIKTLLERTDFSFVYDALSGIAGPYAHRIFGQELGVPTSSLTNCTPLPDFGGHHPDPNLTYAPALVKLMGLQRDGTILPNINVPVPSFGAAADGDADRNMVLGDRFFVTPSDSVAIIAANANCIPYFASQGGVKALARSMPTSCALDRVAEKLNVRLFEVPTGWKFFGNLMDSKDLFGGEDYCPLICGEESFGTGASHIREKDGPWAVLCWLSILAHKNKEAPLGQLVTVRDIVVDHWKVYGRNVYCRYDYEGVTTESALTMMARLTGMIDMFNLSGGQPVSIGENCVLAQCDEFEYSDPVDGKVTRNQGWRFVLSDGSRFVFRLSGTGSVGATIRLYLERYIGPDAAENVLTMGVQEALGPIVQCAFNFSRLCQYTGRNVPTVIT
jgi:phosphoglucomutase